MSSRLFVALLWIPLALTGCALDRSAIDPGADGGRRDGGITEHDGDVVRDAGPDAGCVPSGQELCDGVDNDCDPSTADGAGESTLGEACDGDDADLCAEGTRACVGGALACTGEGVDHAEVCDGVDNDCNPATADGAAESGAACDDPADFDLCAEGVTACVGGALVCMDDGDNADEVEACDGLDNDCNPATADGLGEGWFGSSCDDDADVDLCRGGTYACVAGAQVCMGDDGDQPSEVERCDGVDNDCNPATQDGSAESWIGGPCDDPADADLCPEGAFACVGGVQACSGDDGDQPGEVERCDGVDNDCNPATLDGAGVLGTACDGPDGDLCAEGTYTACTAGTLVCSDATDASTETCNGVDDDCDGVIDDGAGCPCTRVVNAGHSYLFCNTNAQWWDARDACRAVGYQLVTVDSAAEQAFLAMQTTMISSSSDWWIGANDQGTEGTFVWIATSSALSYTAWQTGEPNNFAGGEDCAVIKHGATSAAGEAGGWNDVACWGNNRYVCEAGP